MTAHSRLNLAALLAAALLWGAQETSAQLSQGNTITTQGTQFVRPEEPAKPPPPRPPPVRPRVAPAPPARTAIRSQPAPPPRYPSVVFLVDTSDSMLNQSGGGRTRLAEAKSALIQVIRGMSPETRVQLWVFNTQVKPLSIDGRGAGGFLKVGDAQKRERLIRRIGAIRTAGGTNLYAAIIRVLALFGVPGDQALYRSGQRFPVLVVVSDGEDGGKTRDSLESVLAEREKYPLVAVNTIGFHVSGEEQGFRVLCRIATRPDGCAAANDRDRLRSLLEGFYRPSPAVGSAAGGRR
ncbi:MAG: VWA domain-containing protein [SAR324 cluster bacterium]|nr:VWA domain-containing protein [SAR324 cluster bacterium]